MKFEDPDWSTRPDPQTLLGQVIIFCHNEDRYRPVLAGIAGMARYYLRLSIELAGIYSLNRAAGIDANHSAIIVAHYGILRNGIDGLDALVFKYGRMHDFISGNRRKD